MIPLTYADLFFLYLLVFLLFIAILWNRERLRLKRNEWKSDNTRVFHCDTCHHTFISQEKVNLCRCPKCNAICIRRKKLSS